MFKDAKGLLQKAWVIEAMTVILFACIIVLFLPAWRLELFAKIVVPILGTIGLQGAAAAIGPEVKRNIESRAEIEKLRAGKK